MTQPHQHEPAPKLALFKTTIVIWSDYDPKAAGTEIEELARDAAIGGSFCSRQQTVHVGDARADADWEETDFFGRDGDEPDADACPGGEVGGVIELMGEPIDVFVASDDAQRRAIADGRRWFAKAAPEAILGVASEDWSEGESSDPIAEAAAAWDPTVAAVFEYITAYNLNRHGNDVIGFSASVNKQSAMAWLQIARPDVHALIVAEVGE
jgi:hypothetical protein